MPEVKLTWWDGGMMPPRPDGFDPDKPMGDHDGGVLFLGDKGALMCGCYGRNPKLIPDSLMKDFQPPRTTLAGFPGARRGTKRTGSGPARAVRRPARISSIPGRCRRRC